MNNDNPPSITQVVDARDLACPQPVILTRRAMAKSAAVTTIVNSPTARDNVRRMAEKAGWTVTVQTEGPDYAIHLTHAESPAEEPAPTPSSPDASATDSLVLVVSEDKMGRGPDELGGILVRGFFHTLGEINPRPQAVIFFNSGVHLVAEGSPVLEDLLSLSRQGVALLACGTCLDYFDLRDRLAVGRISNMYEIAETMLSAGKVVTL